MGSYPYDAKCPTGGAFTEDDVERYARIIATAGGDDDWFEGTRSAPDIDAEILREDYRNDARAVLRALEAEGRLLPAPPETDTPPSEAFGATLDV